MIVYKEKFTFLLNNTACNSNSHHVEIKIQKKEKVMLYKVVLHIVILYKILNKLKQRFNFFYI